LRPYITSAKFEAKREQLQGNELYATLEKLEVKIRTAEQGRGVFIRTTTPESARIRRSTESVRIRNPF
jgi:hypothetical protein